MQKKIRTFLLSCFLLVFTAILPAHASEPLLVFVSIAPQKWLVEQLGGDLIKTHVLLDKGQEPHTYQPSPDKMTSLFRSRLYFTLGMPFEREIARKINSNKGSTAGLQLVDVARGIKKIPLVAHQHHEGTGEDKQHKEHDHHQHGKAGQVQQEHADPHTWLDPRNGIKIAAVMAEALATADPEHAAAYQQHFKNLQKKLSQLH
ncbi:MAG: hypothetical protein D3909_15970, partial [Candidatus Electrothrix sp. ATG1]|nr:hypothetical protein [Candidatus Electrothrix sp. ATG1]